MWDVGCMRWPKSGLGGSWLKFEFPVKSSRHFSYLRHRLILQRSFDQISLQITALTVTGCLTHNSVPYDALRKLTALPQSFVGIPPVQINNEAPHTCLNFFPCCCVCRTTCRRVYSIVLAESRGIPYRAVQWQRGYVQPPFAP